MKMKFATLAIPLLAALPAFATPLKWVCEWPEARAQSFTLYHGETATFEPSFRVNGVVATNVAVEACYVQTNGMGEAWWTLADATFHPTNDVGAASYRFFVRARAGGDVVYRANGILRMQDSPGFEPAAVPFPRRVLDFDAVEIANAPWPTAADIEEAASAAIETATNAIPGTVSNIVTKSYVEDLGISGGGGTGDDFIVNVSGDARLPAVDVDNFWYIRNETAGSSVRAYGLWKDWIEDIARGAAAGNYSAVSNAAMKAAQPSAVTNIVEALAYKKVSGAAAGNLPAFGTYGNIVDSGKKPADFASAAAVAAAAAAATNYTDSAATSATNYTDSAAAPIWQYVLGDRVWFAATNYMRTVDGVTPSLQLWEVREGVTNLIYHSTDEVTNIVARATAPLATTQALAAVSAAMPSKAWGRYQSATGADNPAPADVTIISTPVVQLTGGGEWTPHTLSAGGTVWTLESNGFTSISGGTNGYFSIRNTVTGEEVLTVEERSIIPSVPVHAAFEAKDGGSGFIYTVYADSRPTLFTSTNLTGRAKAAWDAQGDDPNVVVNSWTNNGDGTWTADVTLVVPSVEYFAYVGVQESKDTVISNKKATSFDGGVVIGDAKYRLGTALINGVRVLTAEAIQ